MTAANASWTSATRFGVRWPSRCGIRNISGASGSTPSYERSCGPTGSTSTLTSYTATMRQQHHWTRLTPAPAPSRLPLPITDRSKAPNARRTVRALRPSPAAALRNVMRLSGSRLPLGWPRLMPALTAATMEAATAPDDRCSGGRAVTQPRRIIGACFPSIGEARHGGFRVTEPLLVRGAGASLEVCDWPASSIWAILIVRP